MKYKDILDLYASLKKINLPGAKFAYAVAKNIDILEPEIKALQEAQKMSAGYKTYESGRVKLNTKHSEKDSKGKPVIADNSYVIADQEAFDNELKELRETHKEAIEAREAQLKEFNEFLEKETKVSLHKIAQADLPPTITTQQLTSIFSILED